MRVCGGVRVAGVEPISTARSMRAFMPVSSLGSNIRNQVALAILKGLLPLCDAVNESPHARLEFQDSGGLRLMV